MSKLKHIQEVNRKFEERFLMYEQSTVKMRPCESGDKGTLVKTQMGGQSYFGLSKTESYKDTFCYVPDRNTITRTTTPQS